MSDRFSKLPTELRLYILQFVDNQTITQCVSLINKEFNKLSKDYTLYQEYEAAEYDVRGDKLRVELNNELYRSNLKSLLVTSDCLNDYGFHDKLEQFDKLEHLTVVSDATVCLNAERIPDNVKSIRVCGKLFTDNIIGLKVLIPLIEEVDIVLIREEHDLDKKLEIPASLYLIEADLFTSEEFLNRFFRGALVDILNRKNFGVRLGDIQNLTTRDKILNHLAGNVVEICLGLNFYHPDDRDAVKVICRQCTSLKVLSLDLRNIQDVEEVKEVRCTQLQSLRLRNCTLRLADWTKSFMKLRLLIQATKHEINLQDFRPLSLVVLTYFSDSLESLTLGFCSISGKGLEVRNLGSVRSLKLNSNIITGGILMELLNPNITRLDVDNGLELCYLNQLTALEEVLFESVNHIPHVLEALLASRNTLRVFKCGYKVCPSHQDQRDILDLLRQFRCKQYFELTGRESFRTEEIVDLFPAAIVSRSYSVCLGHIVRIFF